MGKHRKIMMTSYHNVRYLSVIFIDIYVSISRLFWKLLESRTIEWTSLKSKIGKEHLLYEGRK